MSAAHMRKVSLPKEVAPEYPDRCAVCGAAHPGHRMLLIVTDYSVGRFGPWATARVPACLSCSLRLHAARVVELGGAFIVIAGAWGVYFLAGTLLPRWLSATAALALGALALYRYAGFAIAHPQPFSVEAYHKSTVYSFRDTAVAREFATLNKAQIDREADEHARLRREAP
jgi:hypothetical protein